MGRILDGKFAKGWNGFDLHGMAAQLGMIEPDVFANRVLAPPASQPASAGA